MTSTVVWFTGLPSSGKTTLARALRGHLAASGTPCALLDGDAVRAALAPPPGHDAAAREAFYATLGNLAVLLARQKLVVLVAATAHRRAWRDAVRAQVERFVEVHVATPREVCEARDPKGLYARAGAGVLEAPLPGLGVEYEPPLAPEVVAEGGQDAGAVELVARRIRST